MEREGEQDKHGVMAPWGLLVQLRGCTSSEIPFENTEPWQGLRRRR